VRGASQRGETADERARGGREDALSFPFPPLDVVRDFNGTSAHARSLARSLAPAGSDYEPTTASGAERRPRSFVRRAPSVWLASSWREVEREEWEDEALRASEPFNFIFIIYPHVAAAAYTTASVR